MEWRSNKDRPIWTVGAKQLCLMGDEVPDTERSDLSPVGFQYLAETMASWTMDQLGRKPYQWFGGVSDMDIS